MEKNNIVFGIDLGTTNSCISVIHNGNPQVLEVDKSTTTPSCVAWFGGDKFIVGGKAYVNRGQSNVANSFKRLMGSDSVVTLQYKGESIELSPVKLSSMVLEHLVKGVSSLYSDVKDVIITVPADFNNRQILDTIKAGELAGLNVKEVLTEPTSAALMYTRDNKTSGNYLVYDLGGGTFDVSVVNIDFGNSSEDVLDIYGLGDKKSNEPVCTVLATKGDTKLGGDDLDDILAQMVIKKIGRNEKLTYHSYKSLISFIERFKARGYTSLNGEFPLKFVGDDKEVNTAVLITTEMFEIATEMIYARTKAYVDEVISKVPNILKVVTVGGSTKNKKLIELISADLEVQVDNYLSPDLSVSQGASLKGGLDLVLYDVIPTAIGVLGDGIVHKVIKGNSQLPVIANKVFATVEDNQKVVSVEIYQGESIEPRECTYLGTLVIDNLPDGEAGTVGIIVGLVVNTNGLLTLSVNVNGRVEKKELVNLKSSETQAKKLTIQDRWLRAANKVDETDREELIKLINESYEDSSVIPQISSILSKYKRPTKPMGKVSFD